MRLRHHWPWFVGLLLLDSLVLVGFWVACVELRGGAADFVHLTWLDILLVVAACAFTFGVIGGYQYEKDMRTLEYASEHLLAMMVGSCVSAFLTYAVSGYSDLLKPSRSALLVAFVLFTPTSLLYRRVLSQWNSENAAGRFFCVLGADKMALALWKDCQKSRFGYRLRFFTLDEHGFGLKPDADLPPIESDFAETLHRDGNRCEGVIIAMPDSELDMRAENILIKVHFHQVPVYPLESFYEKYLEKVPLSRLQVSWILNNGFNAAGYQTFDNFKYAADIAFSILVLILISPLLVLVAFAIRLEGGGPVIFRQTRVGKFGRRFTLYKFRTMRAAKSSDDIYTRKNDPRITRIGYWLRLTRFDEMLQFWNVIQGEMSVIGPRAEWEKPVEMYEHEIPFYHLRHTVKPGITGWAQVNQGYGASLEDACEKLQYDLFYVKNYSLRMDLAIVLKTVYTMFSAAGR